MRTYLSRNGATTTPTPGVNVAGSSPGYTKVVSDSKYMLVGNIFQRAKPSLTCVTPKHEGNALRPRCELGCRAFPKRKFPSIPSIRAVSWQRSLLPQVKIEYSSLSFHPFGTDFSGIKRM